MYSAFANRDVPFLLGYDTASISCAPLRLYWSVPFYFNFEAESLFRSIVNQLQKCDFSFEFVFGLPNFTDVQEYRHGYVFNSAL